MPTPIVAGNWKMNTVVPEAIVLAAELRDALGAISGVEKVVCPPFVSLMAVKGLLDGSSVKLGAQNMHHAEKGAFTGEVSPGMVAGLCQYVILGHSERRQLFGEDDGLINLKVKAAVDAGLVPILCVGETLQQREDGKAGEVVGDQVKAGLDSVSPSGGLVVAYEPVWAIGTGVSATPETASEIMGGAILKTLEDLYGAQTASQTPLLYGGSANPDNIGGFVSQDVIHGGLVGGASLRADQFAAIVKATAAAKSA
jgi:triosephosphate isomerase